MNVAQQYDGKMADSVSLPVKFAAVQAAVSNNKPQLAQASTSQTELLAACLPQNWCDQQLFVSSDGLVTF